jgi:hypothetical protein
MNIWNPYRLMLLGVGVLLSTGPLHAGDVAFDAHSVRSGLWSRADTWAGGRIPGPGDRVQIRPGDTVTYDLASDDPIRMVHSIFTACPKKAEFLRSPAPNSRNS